MVQFAKEEQKKTAAVMAAVKLRDGMVIGLKTGSTLSQSLCSSVLCCLYYKSFRQPVFCLYTHSRLQDALGISERTSYRRFGRLRRRDSYLPLVQGLCSLSLD